MTTAADENLKTQEAQGQVDALNALAWELRQKDPARSVRLSGDAFACAEAIGYPRRMARSLLTQGFYQIFLPRRKRA